MAVSALRTRSTLLPRNIMFMLLVIISVRGLVNPGRILGNINSNQLKTTGAQVFIFESIYLRIVLKFI
jgi:hypothetical protein